MFAYMVRGKQRVASYLQGNTKDWAPCQYVKYKNFKNIIIYKLKGEKINLLLDKVTQLVKK